MPDYLAYWKTFDNYGGHDGARRHCINKGYGSGRLGAIGRGDYLWIVGHPGNRPWALLQRIVVSRVLFDDGRYRAFADPTQSSFFSVADQPSFEDILKELRFHSGKPIAASGRAIGNFLQAPRRLTPLDVDLLFEYERGALAAEKIETTLPADELETPRRRLLFLRSIQRDHDLSVRLKELYDYTCQVCRIQIRLSDNRCYVEAHHIKPLGGRDPGPDVLSNMLCVCPNCHVRLDFGAVRIDIDSIQVHPKHGLGPTFVQFHNEHRFGKVANP